MQLLFGKFYITFPKLSQMKSTLWALTIRNMSLHQFLLLLQYLHVKTCLVNLLSDICITLFENQSISLSLASP